MKNLIKIIFFLSIAHSISASAQDSKFKYNYLQAGYSSGTVDVTGGSFDTSGTTFGGTFATSENTFITGSFGQGTLSVGAVDFNLDNWSVGFGGHLSLSEKTDLVGSLSTLSNTVSLNGDWIRSTGYGYDGAIRHAISDKVELVAGAGVAITGSDRLQTTSLYVGTRFKVSNDFSLGIVYSSARNNGATSSGFGGSARVEF